MSGAPGHGGEATVAPTAGRPALDPRAQALWEALEAGDAGAQEQARAYHAQAGAQDDGGALAELLLGRALLAGGETQAATGPLGRAAGAADAGVRRLALCALGRAQLDLGQPTEAEATLRGAADLAEAHGAPGEAASTLNLLAAALNGQGRVGEALALLREVLALRGAEDNRTGQMQVLTNLGSLQGALGQYPEAVASLGQAYRLYQALPPNPAAEAAILHNLAHVHHQSGDGALALEVMAGADDAARRSGSPWLRAAAALNLGEYQARAGRHAQARGQLRRALRLARAGGYTQIEWGVHDALGTLEEAAGHLFAAEAAFGAALALAQRGGLVQPEIEARVHLGGLHLRAGEPGQALAVLGPALALAETAGLPQGRRAAHGALSLACERQGDLRGALDHARAAAALERELFGTERDRQTRNLSVQFEVERAQHDARLYRLRTEVEHEGRERAERAVRERTAELARAQHEVVTRLALAAEYRDDQTGEHTRRVGRLAARVARALGLPDAHAAVLGVAARLHDVGKIGVPDAVLLKPARLTPAEYAAMQQHTVIGARLLSGGQSALLQMAEDIARTHHEHWDGGGYPAGLAGEAIPLAGRIVAVADVYDALIQARPYKAAWGAEAARAELARLSGRQFDPAVVAAALDVLESGDDAEDGLPDAEPGGPANATEPSHVLAVFEDLLLERTRELEIAWREAELTAERMAQMAHTDDLTGLGNRRAFERDLESRLAGAEPTPFTVVSLDVDGLKAVNDSGGHAEGDRLLCAVAGAVSAGFAACGRAYRIGGDEFAVICTRVVEAPEEGEIRTRLSAALSDSGFLQAAVSLGAAHYPHDARAAGDLLRLSDQRMYAQKVAARAPRLT